jgi:hypothetical protein
MSRMLALVLLVGCRGGPMPSPDTALDTADSAPREDAPTALTEDGYDTSCAGSYPGPVPGFEAFKLQDAVVPTGGRAYTNWAWQPQPVIAVNFDVKSFGMHMPESDVRVTIENAVAFWNRVTENVQLVVGDSDLTCCQGDETDCRRCGSGDGMVDVYMSITGDGAELPAYTMPTIGDDPGSDHFERSCLLENDVRFFPEGRTETGQRVSFNWVARSGDVRDTDSSDGVIDKPLHDTLVHELGHVIGLGDQDDPSVGCSVMSHCHDPACGCSFDEPGPMDVAVVKHVYEQG